MKSYSFSKRCNCSYHGCNFTVLQSSKTSLVIFNIEPQFLRLFLISFVVVTADATVAVIFTFRCW